MHDNGRVPLARLILDSCIAMQNNLGSLIIIRNPHIQNAQLLIFKAGGTYSHQWDLKG
jgi:hypothetical protein